MNPVKILILTAVSMEARALRSSLKESNIENGGSIGIRATHLASLAPPGETSLVMLCGLAGALNPQLGVGDLIMDDPANQCEISDLSFDKHLRRGRIYTATDIIATPAEKAALFQSTGADAVDMEQSIVRDWCDRRGLPLIGLRAISDKAGQTLDPAVLRFVDDLGRPRAANIAAGLLRRPALIPHLMRLNADSKIALEKLAIGVRMVAEALISSSG